MNKKDKIVFEEFRIKQERLSKGLQALTKAFSSTRTAEKSVEINEEERKAKQGSVQRVDVRARPNWLGPYQSYEWQAGGGGAYNGPFKVKKSATQGEPVEGVVPLSIDVASGYVLIYSIQHKGPITIGYDLVDGGTFIAGLSGTIFLKLQVNILRNWVDSGTEVIPDEANGPVFSVDGSHAFIPSTDVDPNTEQSGFLDSLRNDNWMVPLASISDTGKLSQIQYGNFTMFVAPFRGMYYCENGAEHVMRNFGYEIPISEA